MEPNAFELNIKKIQEKIKNHYEDPFLDGPLNISEYVSSPLRIMWLMKEPYDESFSYTDFFTKEYDKFYSEVINGKPWPTWKPVFYVSYGMLHGCLTWEDVAKIVIDKESAKGLAKIAWVNIQKEASLTGTESNDKNIIEAWEKNKELLKEQIEVLDPHVIICGNTFKFIRNDFENQIDYESRDDKFVPYYLVNKRVILDPYHPSYAGSNKINFEEYVNDILRTIAHIRETNQLV